MTCLYSFGNDAGAAFHERKASADQTDQSIKFRYALDALLWLTL